MLGRANRAAVLHVRSRSANGSLLPPRAAYSAPAARGEASRVQAVEALTRSDWTLYWAQTQSYVTSHYV